MHALDCRPSLYGVGLRATSRVHRMFSFRLLLTSDSFRCSFLPRLSCFPLRAHEALSLDRLFALYSSRIGLDRTGRLSNSDCARVDITHSSVSLRLSFEAVGDVGRFIGLAALHSRRSLDRNQSELRLSAISTRLWPTLPSPHSFCSPSA